MKDKGIFKRLSLFALLLIAGFTSALAQSLYMDGFKINTGEVKTVTIDLAQGGYNVYGLQTDIVLSNGLYLDGDPVAVEGAMDDSNPSFSYSWNNGALRIVMFSMNGKAFMPDKKNVIQLSVRCEDYFYGGSIRLTNSRLTVSADGQEISVPNYTAGVSTDNVLVIPEDVWTLPSKDMLEFTDVTFDGTMYYLYNPACDMFFASGNDWNTRASVADFAYPVWFEESYEGNAPEGSLLFWNDVQHPNRQLGSKQLFTDEYGQTWVDRNGQENYSWIITKVGDAYRIQNVTFIQNFSDYEGTYLGWRGDFGDTRLYMIDPEEGNVDWFFVTYDSYQEYKELYDRAVPGYNLYIALKEAQELGINVQRWAAVYMNKDSETYELNDAYQELSYYISYKRNLKNYLDEAADSRLSIPDAEAVYNNPDAELWEIEDAIYVVQDAVRSLREFQTYVKQAEELVATEELQELDEVAELKNYLDALANRILVYNQLWEETQRINSLVQMVLEASKKVVYDGKDMTIFIQNPGFDDDADINYKGAQGWNIDNYTGSTLTRGPLGDANREMMIDALGYMNYCFEAWHNYNWDVWQELYDLPKGMYELEVQGYVRCEVGGYTRGDDIEPNFPSPVYLYMNNAVSSFPSVYSECPADEGHEFTTVESWTTEEVNGNLYPNSMGGAAQCFGWGMYKTKAYGLISKDGDAFRIGVKMNKRQDWWCIFDNFKLTYRTPTPEIVQPVLEAELAKLDLEQPMSKEIFDQLTALKTAAEAAIAAQDGQAMFDALSGIYDLSAPIRESVTLFAELVRANEGLLEAIEKSGNEEAIAEAMTLVETIEAGLENHTITESQLYDYLEQICEARTMLMMPADWASASDENPIDVTGVIKNPSFQNEYEESTDEGWTNPGNLGNNEEQRSALAMEFWDTNFNMYQDIVGLPEGTYMLTVNAWSRNGNYDDNYYSWKENKLNSFAYLYGEVENGNDSTSYYAARVANLMKAGDALLEPIGYPGEMEVYIDDNYFYLPNTLVSGKGLLEVYPDIYTNKVIVKVGADGRLRIGIRNYEYLYEHWVVLDDFKLYYFGKDSKKKPGEVIDIDLSKLIAEANDLLAKPMQAELKTELQQLVETYSDVTATDELIEGYELLSTCLARVRQNVNAYANLEAAITAVNKRLENGDNMDASVVAEATALVGEAQGAYEARELTTYQANDYTWKLNDMLQQLYVVFVSVNIEVAGTLQDSLYAMVGDPWTLQGLKVTGKINDDDIYFIRDLYYLRTIDLSGTDLERLPNWIFEYRDNLQKMELPASLVYVGYGAFSGCYSLQSLTLHSPVPPYGYDRATWDWGYNLYVPEMSVQAYRNAYNWNNWNVFGFEELPEKFNVVNDFEVTWPAAAEYKPDMRIGQFKYDGNIDYIYGAVTMNADKNTTVSLGDFTMVYDPNIELTRRYGWGEENSFYGSLLNNAENMRADNVTIEYWVRRDRWNFFSLPFDVKVSDIQLDLESAPFVIRKYDAAERAAGNFDQTWVNMTADSILHAGEGYIIQSTVLDNLLDYYRDWNGFFFKAMPNANKNNIFVSDDVEVTLKQYASEFTHNQNWNFIGNPYPCFYNIQGMQTTAPITIWNQYDQNYEAYSPLDDEYVLNPGEAFFVQRPLNESTILFTEEGRQARRADVKEIYRARSLAPAVERYVFNFTISDGETTDRTRVVLNEEAKAYYEQAKDASKFMSLNDEVPQIYSVADSKYAINERPIASGEVMLGVHFGKQGTYTIAMNTKVEAEVILVDLLTGQETRLDGTEGYTFEANEGDVNDRFVVRFVGGAITGIQTIANGSDNEKYYNLNGMQIEQPKKGLYLKSGKKVVVK